MLAARPESIEEWLSCEYAVCSVLTACRLPCAWRQSSLLPCSPRTQRAFQHLFAVCFSPSSLLVGLHAPLFLPCIRRPQASKSAVFCYLHLENREQLQVVPQHVQTPFNMTPFGTGREGGYVRRSTRFWFVALFPQGRYCVWNPRIMLPVTTGVEHKTLAI